MGRRREPTEAEKIAEARALIKDAIDTGKTEIDLRTQSPEVLREACEIKTLTKLTLRNLGPTIKTLPKEIAKLELLEGIYFDSNEITSLPPEIGALTKLQTFYGYHNKLTTLPEAFGNLKEIRKLVLWSNELATLPKSFGNLKKMTECELKWNKLKSLPDEIGGLESVEDFDVCSNQLKDLPSDLSGMKKLRRMQLKENKLTSFPRGLLTLPALVELDLGENGLRELPDDIAQIKTLREIDLDDNALTSLPKKLFSLPLTSLKLKANKLKELPPEIVGMRSLMELTVYGNPIKGLDDATARLESRTEILAGLGLLKPKTINDALPAEPERAAILKNYGVRLEKFAREAKRRGGEKLVKVLAFLRGQTNDVPLPALDDERDLASIVDVLAPYAEWSFVDRRVLAFITQDAWRFKQPGQDYFSGFDEHVYRWLEPQVKEGDDQVFAKVAAELVALGVDEDSIIEGALYRMEGGVLREDGSPTSFGKYLIDIAPAKEALLVRQDRSSVKEAIIGLLVRHAPKVFAKIGDKLLVIAPDEDGEIHVPYEALGHACAVDPARYEKLLLEGIEKTNCDPCRAEAARVLVMRYPQHRELALETTRRTLARISERKNKEERFSFYWSGGERWSDGAANYVDWALKTFGKDVHANVHKLVDDTKVFDVDIAEVVAKALGQSSVDMLAEGLDMNFDDDDIAPHFRRMFALLAPLDWSKYYDKGWGLARSEHRQVRETACLALSRLDPKLVIAKTKELLDSKRGHEREAGVFLLTLVKDPECTKLLRALLDTETSDDARDLAAASFFKNAKCDRAEADARIASAKGRGKLDKPAAKWLDEKKLPALTWTGGKKVDPLALRFVLYRQTRQTEITIDAEARGVLALMDRKKGTDFATKLLALVMKNGGVAAKNRFALALVGIFGGEDVVEALEELATEQRNENAVRTIGLVGTMEAARALDRVMKVFRIKYPNVREAAQEAFDAIAEGLGKTPFELADAMIPDFGFVKGRVAIAGVKPPVYATLDADRKVTLVVDSGKVPKLTGKPKDAVKALSEHVKECARQLQSSLEYYLIVRRRWDVAAFQGFFETNPLAFAFARGFVWGGVGGSPSFRVTADREHVGADGKIVALPKGASIGLVHPLEIEAADRAKWLAALAGAGIKPAFPQLDRPTFSPREEERNRSKCFRFEDKEMSGLTFKGRAERRGWRRGSVVDSGGVSAYRKVFPHDQVEVFIGTDGLNVQSYEDSEVTLKDLFFVRSGAVVTGSYTYDEPRDEDDERLIRLGEVPAIVFSEVVADLTAIAKQKEEEES